MIIITKELPPNTIVIQSEHTEQYSKSSSDSAIQRQSMISALDNNNMQRWIAMDNNGQQSAVLHASLMQFCHCHRHFSLGLCFSDCSGQVSLTLIKCPKGCSLSDILNKCLCHCHKSTL